MARACRTGVTTKGMGVVSWVVETTTARDGCVVLASDGVMRVMGYN